jgi:ParB-like chromosome segregation protein Spo0J
LPDTGHEARAAAEALVAKADISVHLIGRRYGVIPEEETRSFGELLYDLAFAQRERTGFHQLVWIPEDLQSPEDAQQALLTKVRGGFDQTTSGKSDVFETSFESFKEGLLDVVSRKPVPPPVHSTVKKKAIYLLCDQPDLRQEQLEKIKAYLRSRGHPVELPPFQGEPEELRTMEEELIGDTDAALIYYGTAKDLWVLRKRKNVLKVLSSKQKGRDYARALYLATPKDDIKAINYLNVSDHNYPEIEGFPPLLLVGDCEEFQPEKLDSFIELIEREP